MLHPVPGRESAVRKEDCGFGGLFGFCNITPHCPVWVINKWSLKTEASAFMLLHVESPLKTIRGSPLSQILPPVLMRKIQTYPSRQA